MPELMSHLDFGGPAAKVLVRNKARFVRCVRLLVRALGTALPERALAAVQVLPADALRPTLAALLACGLSRPQAVLARSQLAAGHSSFWPQARLVLLAGRATSHLAEEAGHFLRQAYAPLRLPRTARDAFYLHTVEEALAYYASKLICPSRRPGSWRPLHGTSRNRRAEAIVATAHAHLAQARGQAGSRPLIPSDPAVSDGVSHLLGYRLGEALFGAVQAGACDRRKMAALFARPTSGRHEALLLYWQLTLALRHYLKPVRRPSAAARAPKPAKATAAP